jgi:hypothetical protein
MCRKYEGSKQCHSVLSVFEELLKEQYHVKYIIRSYTARENIDLHFVHLNVIKSRDKPACSLLDESK